jgi:hypothetical protein
MDWGRTVFGIGRWERCFIGVVAISCDLLRWMNEWIAVGRDTLRVGLMANCAPFGRNSYLPETRVEKNRFTRGQ